MKVSDVMSRRVRTVGVTEGIDAAIRLMLDNGYSGLPVVDQDDRLVGILTEGDLLRRAELGTQQWHPGWLNFLLGPGRLAREYTRTHAQKVQEIMSTEVVAVDESAPLTQAIGLMEEHQIRRLPILRYGKVVGILSRADLLRACLDAWEKQGLAPPVGDDGIRERIESTMRTQPWDPHATVQVSVAGGVVQLHGVVTNDALREALRVLAEGVPGVTKVDDQITTIEPMSGCIVRSPS